MTCGTQEMCGSWTCSGKAVADEQWDSGAVPLCLNCAERADEYWTNIAKQPWRVVWRREGGTTMTVPMAKWGKDHWSTFAFLEHRCVEYRGTIALEKMRCDNDRHPGLAHMGSYGKKYPTILRDGKELPDHDDWDCADDLEEAGLIEQVGTGINPLVKLTAYGWEVAGRLREHKAAGLSFARFRP